MLIGSPFSFAILTQGNFPGAKLDHADFNMADLKKASFNRALLKSTQFYGADLSEASFVNAKIIGSYFKKSNLSKANLNGGQLKGSSFDLTDFSGATMLGTDISGANLKYASNVTCEQLLTTKLFDRKSTVVPIYLKVEWASEDEFTCKRDLCVDVGGGGDGDLNKRMKAKACK